MNTTRSVAVIGGGVAGLAAAAMLSRTGMRVTVFEAADRIGGCCGQTVRDGYTFNDGALYLAFPAVLDHVFERLGARRPELLPLRRIAAVQRTVLPDGTVVTVGDGGQVRVEGGGRNGRDGRDARIEGDVRRLLARWEPVFRLFAEDVLVHPFSLGRFAVRGWRHLPKLRGTVASELGALVADAAARSALAGALLFTGLPPQRTPAPAMLGLVALLSDGFYLPEGGMGRIPDALMRLAADAGADVRSGTIVRSIIVGNGRVAGLATDRYGPMEADAVVSTAHGAATYGSLLRDGVVPERMRRRARRAPLSHRALAVQLGLKNRVDGAGHMNSVLPWMEHQAEVFRPSGQGVRWLNFAVPTVTMPELAPPGGSIIEAHPAIPQDVPVDEWDERRTERFVEPTLEALARIHPLEVATMRVVTPRDFRDRLHLHEGAVYGLSPAADPRAHFPHRTPVRGLFLAGHTTYPGFGVASAAMSGILAAEALVKVERV